MRILRSTYHAYTDHADLCCSDGCCHGYLLFSLDRKTNMGKLKTNYLCPELDCTRAIKQPPSSCSDCNMSSFDISPDGDPKHSVRGLQFFSHHDNHFDNGRLYSSSKRVSLLTFGRHETSSGVRPLRRMTGIVL